MKILGWIAFVSLIGIGLIIYNVKYVPMQVEHARIMKENEMWQKQVKELQERLAVADSLRQPSYMQTFLWDDLFSDALGFNLTEPAQVMLKEILPKLQETSNEIVIAGHCDKQALVPDLQGAFRSARELSFAKAMVVANFLKSWGVPDERIVCIGYGQTRPDSTVDSQNQKLRNRRIEIIVK